MSDEMIIRHGSPTKVGKKMSKIAVIYWSGTGNTEQMALAVLEGAKEKDCTLRFLCCR